MQASQPIRQVTALLSLICATLIGAPPATGPQTEKRFPPLKVPAGFKATLFACDPLVEYPSVIAIGPRQGTLFVAHDYMTGLGVKIVRRDEVRLLSDTDGDGYADTSRVYAKGFNSIQGLAYSNGRVFVMHAPLLTSLRDTDGDGVADERRDIVKGLGLPPERNSNRLHCANGVVVGYDGWLYLALGDRGCDVKRPEGDRLLFQEGGILRCREDGRGLHVFSGGLRNIYDIALDADLNVFVRDNENDGGDYMIRVCRSFFGADHGYPYLYNEHPDESLEPLVDLGRGSSAGGTAYLETAFPPSFQQSLFFCEWGRAVVRFPLQRSKSHFASSREKDFASGAATDPYGFKPTDLVVDYDGSLLISDWCDGQRPKRGRGRIYRITHGNPTRKVTLKDRRHFKWRDLYRELNDTSFQERLAAQNEIARRGRAAVPHITMALRHRLAKPRARRHLVWLLVQLKGAKAVKDLLTCVEQDPDARVRMQAVRAVGDLTDPILLYDRIEKSGRGDARVARRLAALGGRLQDPRVNLEIVVALARLKWREAASWLRGKRQWMLADPSLRHAAMQLLRRSDNWPGAFVILDEPVSSTDPLQRVALRALANQHSTLVVDGLIQRLKTTSHPGRRQAYLRLLARVYKRPAPWVYWGFRPAPRPPHTVNWARTKQVVSVFRNELVDPKSSARSLVLSSMRREGIPIELASLRELLKAKTKAALTAEILRALDGFPRPKVAPLLNTMVRSTSNSQATRIAALKKLAAQPQALATSKLLELIRTLDASPVQAEAIRLLAQRKDLPKAQLQKLKGLLDSPNAQVRAFTLDLLSLHKSDAALNSVARLSSDDSNAVQLAAAKAIGRFKLQSLTPVLKRYLSRNNDGHVISACLDSLRELQDRSGFPLLNLALRQRESQLAVIRYLEQFGRAGNEGMLLQMAATSRSIDRTIAIARAYQSWLDKSASKDERRQLRVGIARLHHTSSTLVHWQIVGQQGASPVNSKSIHQRSGVVHFGTGSEAMVTVQTQPRQTQWVAHAAVYADRPQPVEFLASASGHYQVWLNGRRVFRRDKTKRFIEDSDLFSGAFQMGENRVAVVLPRGKTPIRFRVRFRHKANKAEHERLVALALQSRGNIVRGRDLFFRVQRTQCAKCHRIGDRGGKVGPDLTGVGARFSKVHLIESILQPSRTIAPSYEAVAIVLDSGEVLSGVKVAETNRTLTLGDKDGKLQEVPKARIDVRRRLPKSLMPEGLEKPLSDREFIDLIAFLQSQKKRR